MSGRKRKRSSALRVVLDTNGWISLLRAHTFQYVVPALAAGRMRLVVSADLRTEINQVASRERFRRQFDLQEVVDAWRGLYAIKALESVVVESAHVGLCADPKDDFLLNLCLDARPDVLVSGDRLVREAAAGARFQPLRVWQLAELRAYAAEPARWMYGLP